MRCYCNVLSVPRFNNGTVCSVRNVTSNSVDISWPAVKGATRYTYRYGSESVVPDRTTTTTSVNVGDLTPATDYWFLVVVHGANGEGNIVTCRATTGSHF